MITEEEKNNALYVEFRNFQTPNGLYTYEKNLKDKPRYIQLGSCDVETDRQFVYGSYNLNNHHFKPEFYNKYVFPVLFKELLGKTFEQNEYTKVEMFDGQYDVSYLKPKNNLKFHVWCNQNHTYGDFSTLMVGPESCITKPNTLFHDRYVGGHTVCRIINESADNDYKLFISSDSHMIPAIPILACNFREIISSDNRSGFGEYKPEYDYLYEDKSFSHVLIAVSGCNLFNGFINKNFDKRFCWLISAEPKIN